LIPIFQKVEERMNNIAVLIGANEQTLLKPSLFDLLAAAGIKVIRAKTANPTPMSNFLFIFHSPKKN
jgi:hypothetical protein